jgi:NAD(P)-dependent dehydrogenase (short-subunit alcohol dehydrogenase family)
MSEHASPEAPLRGRTAIVTGAGRGLGRAHALSLASHGAAVIVNDPGVGVGGDPDEERPAASVVSEIISTGGQAIANYGDCSDWTAAEQLVAQAVDEFGGLDVLVNNAGIVRDRMSFQMSEHEWDSVVRVHLKGHFAPSRAAAAYWRDQSKRGLRPDARIINTSSESGLFGSIGQVNYAAAKAGIAAMTLVQAAELERYGVTVNAIAPRARTRMTVNSVRRDARPDDFDDRDPAQVSPLVTWLAGPASRHISGQTFLVFGSTLGLLGGWHPISAVDAGRRPFDVGEIASAMTQLFGTRSAGVPSFAIDLEPEPLLAPGEVPST